MSGEVKGHLLAIFTILCWGTTFIATKILLIDFSPVTILITRFAIGLAILYVLRPGIMRYRYPEHRWYIALAGLSGISLYYLMENIALTYTYASNVGIITATAPFFSAILARFTLKNHRLSVLFFIGFIISMMGVVLISWEAHQHNVNLRGDMLALAAAILWAIYAVVTKKICGFGYDMIMITREIFLYGIILMLPAIFLLGINLDIYYLMKPINLFNMLYLGIGASALCFVSWNIAMGYLGVIKTTVYIYAVPVITVITAAIVLGEVITPIKLAGMALAITGLIISQK